MAAPALLACGLVLVAAAALATALVSSARAQDRLVVLEERHAAAQSLHERLALAGVADPRSLARFGELVDGGLLSRDHRAWWTEFAAARAQALAPLGFAVELGPPRADALPADAQRWFDESGQPPAQLWSHDLQLRVEGLHEAEIAALVADLADRRRGAIRLQECALVRRSDGVGLDASCVLRFATLEWPEASP